MVTFRAYWYAPCSEKYEQFSNHSSAGPGPVRVISHISSEVVNNCYIFHYLLMIIAHKVGLHKNNSHVTSCLQNEK